MPDPAPSVRTDLHVDDKVSSIRTRPSILTHRSERDEDVRTIWLWPRTHARRTVPAWALNTCSRNSLAYAALLAATIEYCEIVKRRVAERQRMADNEVAAEAGLRGVVRVFLADAD